jgi:NADPH-dependent curcumin reductase CurA
MNVLTVGLLPEVSSFFESICNGHRSDDRQNRHTQGCARGIGVNFENAGETVSHFVLQLLKVRTRIRLCGLIAHYNDTLRCEGVGSRAAPMTTLLTRRTEVRRNPARALIGVR